MRESAEEAGCLLEGVEGGIGTGSDCCCSSLRVLEVHHQPIVMEIFYSRVFPLCK